MRRVSSARRAVVTTSCDVIPSGLSTRTTPSTVLALIVFGRRLAHLGEERLDLRSPRDAFVVLEGDLWRHAKPERAADARSKVAGRAGQSLERRFPLLVRTHDADENLGVS